MPLQAQRPERCASTISPPGRPRSKFKVLLILSDRDELDNSGIFWHSRISSMRKLLFTAAFLMFTFFGFLFTMMFSLVFYRSYLAKMHTVAQNKTIYAALPTAQNSFFTEIIATDGRTEAKDNFSQGMVHHLSRMPQTL